MIRANKFNHLNPTAYNPINLSEIPKTSANKIKVMNWNVNYWKKLDSTLINVP